MSSTRALRSGLVALLPAGLLLPIVLGSRPARGGDTRPPAVLLLEQAPADEAAQAQVRLARQHLEETWRVQDASTLPGLALADPDCLPASRAGRAGRVIESLRAGSARFFEQTDLDGARSGLQAAVDAFLQSPCCLATVPDGRAELASGAVLLVRLHLLAGRPEAAADLGRRLLRALRGDELAGVDVPPEVSEFLDRVRRDVEEATVPLEVRVPRQPGTARMVLLDGRPVPDGEPSVPVARGPHVLTLLQGDGAWTRRLRVEGPDRVAIDPVLSASLRAGPDGTLVAGPDAPAGEALARRLAEATGFAVLRLPGAGSGDPLVVTSDGASRDPFVPGPRVRRKAWPWPWMTGATTAGLLAAGIVLNVQSNRAAEAVNDGTNRLDERNGRKAGSIACYALAAAAGAGTVVLAILGRPGPEKVLVSPLPGGAAVAFAGGF